jgi:hypothetical protein
LPKPFDGRIELLHTLVKHAWLAAANLVLAMRRDEDSPQF